MKRNIKLFGGASVMCGLFTILGSIFGHAFSQTALFIGAAAGGIFGIVLSVFIFLKLEIIRRESVLPTLTWGLMFFSAAALFAVTNLNSPVIPLLCVLFTGLGCAIGNTLKLNGQQQQFYFASLGFFLIVPTFYFVTGSLLKYNLGLSHSFTLLDWLQRSPATARAFNLISPVIFIGGTMLAVVLNLPLKFRGQPQHFISFSYSNVSKINLVVACFGTLLLSVLMLYLFLENF